MTAKGWAVVSLGVSTIAALIGVGLMGAQALFDGFEDDPRLPNPKLATERIYGELRPRVNPPHRAMVVAHKVIDGIEYRVQANRATFPRGGGERRSTRFWYIASRPGGNMLDYDSTTSQKRAQGWIDAINAGTKHDF